MAQPLVYIIAGPNGAGKTTFARRFLLDYTDCREFVNADMIAAGLSPFAPEKVAMEAGRIMLRKLDDLAARRETFAFETTLSGRAYAPWIRKLKIEGYRFALRFLALQMPESSLSRVKRRVELGGHNIPEEDIRRRFPRGLFNFFHIYRGLVDSWTLYDNTMGDSKVVASGGSEEASTTVLDPEIYAILKKLGKCNDA